MSQIDRALLQREPAGRGPATRSRLLSFASLSREQARSVLEIRPDPVDSITRPGRDAYHVLMFGGGALKGIGLRSHELGLPGGVANGIAAARARGVRIDVVVDANPTSESALQGLRGMRLRRYDAIVVFLGHHENAQLQHMRWRGALTSLIKLLVDEAAPSTGLFVYDSSNALDVAGARLSRAATANAQERIAMAADLCRVTQRVRFEELDAPVLPRVDEQRFAEGTYEEWSVGIAARVVRSFLEGDRTDLPDSPRRYRARPQAEVLRQRAVTSLRLSAASRDEALDREVRQARLMYGAADAALTIVDGEQVWTRATAAGPLFSMERATAFCDLGIRSDGLLLITDAETDPRARAIAVAGQKPPVRFYAGVPVTSWDGYRLGMICVTDPSPRECSPQDLGGLREVAIRVERLLRTHALRGAA